MGTATASIRGKRAAGDRSLRSISGLNLFVALLDVTPSASYATGGDSFSVSGIDPGLVRSAAQIEYLDIERHTSGFTATFDRTNNKLLVRDATGAEVAAASDQSSRTFRCLAVIRQ